MHNKVVYIKAANRAFANARGRSEVSGSSPGIQKAAAIKNAFVGLLHQVQAPRPSQRHDSHFGETAVSIDRGALEHAHSDLTGEELREREVLPQPARQPVLVEGIGHIRRAYKPSTPKGQHINNPGSVMPNGKQEQIMGKV